MQERVQVNDSPDACQGFCDCIYKQGDALNVVERIPKSCKRSSTNLDRRFADLANSANLLAPLGQGDLRLM